MAETGSSAQLLLLAVCHRRAVLVSLLAAALAAGPGYDVAQALDRPAPNVVALTMRTPIRGFNRMVVTLTLCAPGTQRCAIIDNIMVDTGAVGLRLEASAVPDWLRLPPHVGPRDEQRAQCVHFLHDDAWGLLHRADLHLGGMTARDLVVQILDDEEPRRPPSCRRSPILPTSNGTLGLGPYATDCRGACEQSPERPTLFACETMACHPVAGPIAEADRMPNPVALFAGYDNGLIIDLPPAPRGGTRSVTGMLTFGVGTAENNQLGGAALLPLDARGRFTTVYEGTEYPESYIDSGTGTYIVPGHALPRCADHPWALCVTPEREFGAVMVGRNAAPLPMPFRIGSYDAVAASGSGASGAVATAAEGSSRAFVWGAPFFLGKRVGLLMEGRRAPGASGITGPLYAIEAARSVAAP